MSNIAEKTYESAPARKVAFIGLGVMGYPMAGHLARAGHSVTVYNRSSAKAAAWVAVSNTRPKTIPVVTMASGWELPRRARGIRPCRHPTGV